MLYFMQKTIFPARWNLRAECLLLDIAAWALLCLGINGDGVI